MIKIFVGVGHGMKPDGTTFDPGASGGPGFLEHDWAQRVCDSYVAALKRCGFKTSLEGNAGRGHDPNWLGSAKLANAFQANFADEIHFNASPRKVGHGVEVWVHPGTSPQNRECAKKMATAISEATGLANRGVKESTHLGWLNATSMPSTLPEIAFIDNPGDQTIMTKPDFVRTVGEALARARCESSGVPYVAP